MVVNNHFISHTILATVRFRYMRSEFGFVSNRVSFRWVVVLRLHRALNSDLELDELSVTRLVTRRIVSFSVKNEKFS